MPIIKLTETHYIDTDIVGEAFLQHIDGVPRMELRLKIEGLTWFRGDEALEAWANWKAHIDAQAKAEVAHEPEAQGN